MNQGTMPARLLPEKFLVAFSFAGEQRELVRSIAAAVEARLGAGTVFLDDWYEHYIAGADADLKLQEIYGKRCALVIACISDRYGGKPWTQAEHEAIRARLMHARASDNPLDRESILPIRVGDGEVPGIPFTTIAPDVRERPVEGAAQLIIDRLRLVVPDLKLEAALAEEHEDATIPKSQCSDPAVQALSDQLHDAYNEQGQLISEGADSAEVQACILDLRRRIREGGRLRAGDFVVDGRYKLIEALKQGGFGTIYRAFDTRLRRLVAIKVLHGQYADDRSRRERFFRGARKMAELQHQGIVQVLEPEQVDECHYLFVMEYLPGGDLRDVVLKQLPEPAWVLDLLLEVGAALAFAQTRGMIHRDVKPANIVLDADGRPKLTDFDLVRADDTTGGTRTGALGTFGYAAPEIMHRPQDADARADVYGLGMTGIFALRGADPELIDVVRDLDGLVDELPVSAAIKLVLARAVTWQAADRYENIQAFCDALKMAREQTEVGSKTSFEKARHVEQVSHGLLNDIIDELEPEVRRQDLRHFYTRLDANFGAIYTLFSRLYGTREDFVEQLAALVDRLARAYIDRPPELGRIDMSREEDHNWFLSQDIVGMALYCDAFAGNLEGLQSHLPYLSELGVNMVHILSILACPEGASDGCYAVSQFRDIDSRVGSLEDLRHLGKSLRKRGMLLTLDVIVNHTSDAHEWATRAKAGEQEYQDFYYMFDDRDIPDMFEETMPEIFPETSPGNFTWDPMLSKWVMTVFNSNQWDLNYANPRVLIEMVDVILFWANQGADIMRLDAVAFLWKKIGTTCQNEQEAHLLLQLMKDCCQVVAPGVVFIAEAIVAPLEVIKYFGEDAVIAKECEIAYNATFMALLWNSIATKSTRLLEQGILSLPNNLGRATWLNYLRCDDEIGLGFDDADIRAVDYEPKAHLRFLVDWFTGSFNGSPARGRAFGVSEKTGDARISGSLASLVGLETALETGDQIAIDLAIDQILLLHGLIMSYGGIPLLYYGDEIGTLSEFTFLAAQSKAGNTRWLQRPRIDWEKAKRRHEIGSVEHRIFDGLKKMISVRRTIPAFADFNNRELVCRVDPHLFAFLRTHPQMISGAVLVVANFDVKPRYLDFAYLSIEGLFRYGQVTDLYSGETLDIFNDSLVVPPSRFYWLTAELPTSVS